MHTEEEARRKECPMTTIGAVVSVAVLRNITDEVEEQAKRLTFCGASDCMMWRWDNDDFGICKQTGEGVPFQGYCGLGGKP